MKKDNKKKLSLKKLRKEHKVWSTYNFGKQPTYISVYGIMEELGELSHAQAKDELGIRGTPEELKMKKKSAIADIVIYLAEYCRSLDMKLDECVAWKWEIVKKRDFKKYPMSGEPL
jgi:NTP pyrophosphatase (non-canonical NTP hydrolase)